MARTDNLEHFLTDVASSIKTQTGNNTDIPAADFDTEILSINTVNNQNKTVTPSTSVQNIQADSGYTGLGTVIVNATPIYMDNTYAKTNIAAIGQSVNGTGNLSGIVFMLIRNNTINGMGAIRFAITNLSNQSLANNNATGFKAKLYNQSGSLIANVNCVTSKIAIGSTSTSGIAQITEDLTTACSFEITES